MAKVLGKAGRFLHQEAGRKQQKMIAAVFGVVGILAWVSGLLIGLLFQKRLWWVSLLMNGLAVVLIVVLWKWVNRQINQLQKQRRDLQRGEEGEVAVARRLEELPDTFCVIHDLNTEAGNLDHVVVGPTGVFAIDTKNWRGTVEVDGNGELLGNGQPTTKREVKQFLGRIMGIRERAKALAHGLDPYIQPVFVFTSARVEAKWGTTRNVHCIRDEQLHEYILNDWKPKKLTPAEVQKIAQAFLALARMDTGFDDGSVAAAKPSVSPVEPMK